MYNSHRCWIPILFAMTMSGFALPSPARCQEISALDRERGKTMLRVMRKDIEENFYDRKYKGINLDTLFAVTAHRIDAARTNNEMFTMIEDVMNEFQDSHMFFLPPGRAARVDYGWTYQMFGDSCFVTAVKPGSDAESKGLHPGDRILSIGKTAPSRENDWALRTLLTVLNPQPGMKVVAQSAGNSPREITAMADVRIQKRVVDLSGQFGDVDYWDLVREIEWTDYVSRHRHHDLNDSVHIWKMTDFLIDEGEINDAMDDVQDKKALVLDLRGNPGGYVKTLECLVGRLFDHDMSVGVIESRTGKKPWLVRQSSRTPFKGLLVILVDSMTGSAAEILARLVQIEHRGIVIGDRTWGAVGTAKSFVRDVGAGSSIFYAVSVTTERLAMSDGGNLEGTGVVPDERVLPGSADLAQGRDPVLSYAVWLVGSTLYPESAGKLFPVEWKK